MKIISFDPGQKGAICILLNGAATFYPMPQTPDEISSLMIAYGWGEYHVFVEKAQAMPKNGAVGMFNYGRGFGEILGILTYHKAPFTLVHPRTWCRLMHQGTSKDGTAKSRSLEAARRLFPNANLFRSVRCKKPDEGFIDALLIAEYGRRVMSGKA